MLSFLRKLFDNPVKESSEGSDAVSAHEKKYKTTPHSAHDKDEQVVAMMAAVF